MADHAADGEEGLDMASEGLHDVLIVDRMLPKLDGLGIIRKLRDDGNTHAGAHPQRARATSTSG